jgi:eukaryotic-like serine/threonine-protein kinase
MVEPTQPAAPTPSPDDKKQVEAMVADCIEAMERGEPDPAARVCSTRPEFLTRVQRRLAQLASRGLIPGTDQLPPPQIGPYRILRELGSGGMGSVYLAEQSEPVRREVALKVVKLGMDTREVVARFQAERQALARMNHPHIAQVFDAGITGDGRPFFVMEYVAGQSLTTFCDKRKFSPEQRIQLLATVCRAVQHAHDRGFIHRDLKPSNVLVVEHEGQMMPKVIDFGIAKATAAGSDSELRTRADQVLGTPEYMSPEQAITGGLDVDTRSDVYSLGAILYELLCGELPFDSLRLRRAGRIELERILQDELPTQPSRRLSLVGSDVLAARGGERSTVQRRVHGELDWITLKALAKQPEHRYPSALAFAEDLERWMRHEPVLAAPPGAGYRLRKFVRRHRVSLLAATAVVISLITGLTSSLLATAQARRAEERATAALDDVRAFYDLARDAVGNLVDIADHRLAEVPQAEPVRREMLDNAIRFYAGLQARKPTDPALRVDLIAANLQIGVLQRQLGQPADAMLTLQRCVTDAVALRSQQPQLLRLVQLSIQARSELARSFTATGRSAEAKATLREGLAELEAARSLSPTEALDSTEGGLLANLAIESDDDVPAALDLYQQALAAFARASAAKPDDVSRQLAWARCQARYAQVLTRGNHLDEAATELTAAATRLQAMPTNASTKLRETAAGLQDQFATTLRRLGRKVEARQAQVRANELYARLAEEHPDVLTHADNQASGLHFLAQMAGDDGDLAEARKLAQRAIDVREQLVANHPQDYRLRMRYARSIYNLADIEIQHWQQQGGTKDTAEEVLQRAMKVADELFLGHPEDAEVMATFTSVHEAMASMLAVQGRNADAIREHLELRKSLETMLAHHETDPELHSHLAMVDNNLVQAYFLLGEPDNARKAGERGMKHLERGLQLDAHSRGLLDVASSLVGRLAIAQQATDDLEGATATLLSMCEHQDWGTDTRERGCMMLAQITGDRPEGPRRAELMRRAATELRAAIAARGDLAAAIARPEQHKGFSHTKSRLRDYDLRVALADVLDDLDQRDEQQKWLDEAVAIDKSYAGVSEDRLRNLFAQRTELALHREDTAGAAALLEELLARLGPDGGEYYLAAVLFTRCTDQAKDAALRDHYAGRAVECLRLSVEKKEVKPEAARHPNFAPLSGRADYQALVR